MRMANGIKRKRLNTADDSSTTGPRRSLLGEGILSEFSLNDTREESSSDENLQDATIAINTEYAKRFEHNKKREELHRCK